MAAVVVFFFPVAAHAIHPGSWRLGSYRISIPWTLAILPPAGVPGDSFVAAFAVTGTGGGWGWTRFWRFDLFSSEMGFGVIDAAATTRDFNETMREMERAGAAGLIRRDFRMGDVALSCWQCLPVEHGLFHVRSDGTRPLLRVDCATAASAPGPPFYAWFIGRRSDLEAYYSVVQTLRQKKGAGD